MTSLGFITIAVIGWQVLILLSSIACALVWGKKGAMAALGFWVFWTLFMLFFPPLICVQLTFTLIGAGIAFPVGAFRDWMVKPKDHRVHQLEEKQPTRIGHENEV